MPPRLPIPTRIVVSNLCIRPAASSFPSITSTRNASAVASKKRHRDPYLQAQAKQRKAALVSRRAVLEEQRKIAFGDPVRGIPTPFLDSFDTVGGSAIRQSKQTDGSAADGTKTEETQIKSPEKPLLNHFLTPEELEAALTHSYTLAKPTRARYEGVIDPKVETEDLQAHEEGHKRAVVALERITSLANASSKEKTRANIRRCVEHFGRHNTDEILRPRAPLNPIALKGHELAEKTPRAGPDTGSSEVQIAILTAKIKVLADKLEEKKGKNDKVGKRDLRLLVHRRQKLLKYMFRKERGSDRWHHLIDTLGLTEGTYRGEITL